MHTELLSRIAANSIPESCVAGATVWHRDADTPRFSDDLGLFHDVTELNGSQRLPVASRSLLVMPA